MHQTVTTQLQIKGGRSVHRKQYLDVIVRQTDRQKQGEIDLKLIKKKKPKPTIPDRNGQNKQKKTEVEKRTEADRISQIFEHIAIFGCQVVLTKRLLKVWLLIDLSELKFLSFVTF